MSKSSEKLAAVLRAMNHAVDANTVGKMLLALGYCPQTNRKTKKGSIRISGVAGTDGRSPMVWRRVLVPAAFTLRELHGVIQVAMGWEGFHLFQFCLRAVRYGSWELSTSSRDITLASLRLRKDARFIYEYDLNIPWRHEVRIEDLSAPEAGKTYPICVAGDGACPPEDCGGPNAFMEHRNDIVSLDSRDDLATIAEIIGNHPPSTTALALRPNRATV